MAATGIATRIRAADEGRGAHLPGEVGVWLFILGDMTAFALFFTVFVTERGQDPDLFNASRDTLHVSIGAINTLLLLTGSLFVARAVCAVHAGRLRQARRWIDGAVGTGLGFAAGKVYEYSDQAAAGHGIADNKFYTYYYMFTGIHLTHLVIGVGALLYMRTLVSKPALTFRELRNLENAASYWHMVDLLWIVLFALLYLMG